MEDLSKEQIQVIIAEDHELVREALTSLLEAYEISVIGAVANGIELLEMLQRKKPDVILLDLRMPEMDGDEALDIIHEKYPELKIIIITSFEGSFLKYDLIQRGAHEFLKKNCNIGEMLKAIKDVVNNRIEYGDIETEVSIFTRRELQIMPLMCTSYTMKEIAAELGITEKAVEAHRQRIYEKTNSHSKADFMNFAVEGGVKFIKWSKKNIERFQHDD